jgi:hypothetical protein
MKKAKRPSKASRKLKPQERDNEEFMENFKLDSDYDLLDENDQISNLSCEYEKSLVDSEDNQIALEVKNEEILEKEIKEENKFIPDSNLIFI